jgi:3-dehydroquinate dehydratase II
MILVINGPNLSQLGARNPAVYGSATLDEILDGAREQASGEIDVFTSNSEGEIVDRLHAARTDGTSAVVINPGALGHYSYALRDALELLDLPKVEVHLAQTAAREEFRHTSVISPVVDVSITGAKGFGYRLAVQAAQHLAEQR